MHKASLVVDHCTQREQNPLIHLRYITTNTQHLLSYNGHKCYFLAQSQRIFYMDQVPIVADYRTTYEQNQPFFSEISQQR